MSNYHEKIKAFRKEQRLSQKEFADKVGFKPAYISAIELGSRPATIKMLDAITKAFNLPAGWYLEDTPTTPPTAPVQAAPATGWNYCPHCGHALK